MAATMGVRVSGGGAAGAAAAPPAEYTKVVEAMREKQREVADLIQRQALLEAQHNENTMVKAVRCCCCWLVPLLPPGWWRCVVRHPHHTTPLNPLQELEALGEGEHAYKLMGKVLVRLESSEALSTVNGRLKIITADRDKVEASIVAKQEEARALQKTMIEMHARMGGGGGSA